MADFSKPAMGGNYTLNYNDIKANTNAVAAMFKGVVNPTNLPQYSVKLDNGVLQRWNGSAWLGEQIQIQSGGTGASTAEGARANLSVYSKAEIDTLEGQVQSQIDSNDTDIATLSQLLNIGSATVNMAGKGDFTGGTLYCERVGNIVTLMWSSLGHPPSYGPSALNVIPVGFKPLVTVENTYDYNYFSGKTVRASTNGDINFYYYDETAGSPTTATSAGSITYRVA